MKETKTVSAGTDCPTLLHYLAKVIMREDAGLIMFSEELPHVEAAARGTFRATNWRVLDVL
jgi:diaphanous 1